MATFTPQAQSGLDYLKTVNPALAASIQKSFSPAASTPIDASTIGSTSSVVVPPAQNTPLPNYSSVQVSQPPIPQITNTPAEDALQTEQNTLTADITAAGDKLATKSTRKADLETAQGIPGLNSQLNELNNQIRSVQSQALQATNTSEDRQAPSFAIVGEQAAIERQRAVRVYGLAAAAEAIQGNISLANDYVTRTLDAEFGGIEQEIENKKFLLTQNKDNFTLEEARRAEAQQIELDKQKEAVAAAKQDRSDILQIMLTAAQNGADNATLQKIQSAATPQEAASAAGNVLGAKFAQDKQQQDFENSIKLASLAIDQAKLRNDTAAASIDPAQALAYAQQYASTGTIPTGMPKGSFGVISQITKELPKPEGTIIDTNTSTKPAISDAKLDGFAALYDINNKVAQLKELDQNRYKGLVSATLGKTFGSTNQQKYVDLRTEIIDLLARARTGAALTAQEEKFYADQLPGRIGNVGVLGVQLGADTQVRIDNFASKISSTLDTKLKAQQAAIVGFSKVKIGGEDFVVGQTITNSAGQTGRVNADGTITLIQ